MPDLTGVPAAHSATLSVTPPPVPRPPSPTTAEPSAGSSPAPPGAGARPGPAGGTTFVNPVLDTGAGRDHGDPFVLRHQGRYYLYYTGATGIEVWTGTDLVHWEPAGLALVAPETAHWAETDLWAPEVMYADGVFYMYVTGTRKAPDGIGDHPGAGVGVNHGDDALRRQGVARSVHPTGPFVLDPKPLLDVWSIDGHPFVDIDGRRWLFYNVRGDATRYSGADGEAGRTDIPGCGNIVDELVAPDAVTGIASVVTIPSLSWEGNRNRSWFWNEGPTVLRRRGRYVQMYSGGYYGDETYGVGYATSDVLRGPWEKAPHNPIFRSHERITGPGHHSVVQGPDGVTLYSVYHGYVDGVPGRKVHVDRLHWSTEGPRLGDGTLPGVPTEGEQPLPEPAAYDPRVPYWHAELWVRASVVRLGNVRVEVQDPAAAILLHVTQREDRVRVLLDGRLVVDDAVSGDPAAVVEELRSGRAVDGEVLSLVVTTWREDEQVLTLAAGESLRLPWGGGLPVELSVAVAGTAGVRLVTDEGDVDAFAVVTSGADDEVRDTSRDAGDGTRLPDLVRLRSTRPVAALEITAGDRGTVLSDVVLTARVPVGDPALDIPGQRPPAA